MEHEDQKHDEDQNPNVAVVKEIAQAVHVSTSVLFLKGKLSPASDTIV